MQNPDDNSLPRIIFSFGFALAILLLLIFAFQVDMPVRVILLALAFSNAIFLGVALLGPKIKGRKK